MTAAGCQRIAFDELTDYAAGDLTDAELSAFEEHLFACAECAARAAEFDLLVRAIPPAVRSGEITGFATDAILNRLARDGVRLRTYALSPGATVPCAVWDDDDVMALRLAGDLRDSSEFTLSQRIAGKEVIRVTGQIASSKGEIIYALPAAWVRQLPVTKVEVFLTAKDGDKERPVGSYTLLHEGSLKR